MERIKVIHRGKCCGEAVLCGGGDRMEIRVTAEDPGDGLYRAVLRGEDGQLALGVLEPAGGRLILCRRPCRGEVEALGQISCVETVCTFPFQKKRGWEMVRQPENLFRSQAIRKRLEGVEKAWLRKEGTHRLLALELVTGEPFPLELFFCLGRVKSVEGRRCVVYEFDEEEVPQAGESSKNVKKLLACDYHF